MNDDDERAERYTAADARVRLLRQLLARAAGEGRLRAFFGYAAALARAMNDRADAVDEAVCCAAGAATQEVPALVAA